MGQLSKYVEPTVTPGSYCKTPSNIPAVYLSRVAGLFAEAGFVVNAGVPAGSQGVNHHGFKGGGAG